MKITKLAVKRPITIIVCLILIILGSVFAFMNIPLEVLPTMKISVITVQTIYPTATPFEVEKYVSIPLEEALTGIESVGDITTTSVENASVITLSFDYKDDIDRQLEEVKQKVDDLIPSLPDGILTPTISTFNLSEDAVVSYSVSSEVYDREELQKITEDKIIPKLQPINGVASLETIGVNDDYIKIELDNEKMADYGIDAVSIISLIKAMQMNVPIGSAEDDKGYSVIVKGEAEIEKLDDLNELLIYQGDVKLTDIAHVTKDDANTATSVAFNKERLEDNDINFDELVDKVKTKLTDAGLDDTMYELTTDPGNTTLTLKSPYLYKIFYDQFQDYVVKEDVKIRLADFADITIKKTKIPSISHYDGEETLVVNVFKDSETNTNTLVKDVKEVMDDLRIKNVDIELFNNQGDFIVDSINSVLSSLAIGGILAIVILFLFLHNLRGSILVAISIPISLLMTIDLMYIFKVPLNVISLGGMAVAVGMVVDAAIVITERLYYYYGKEQNAELNAVQATHSVGGAVLASTITTIAVFLPITFTQGFTKSVFEQIAYVVTFALISSCLVAFTVVPLLFKAFYENKKPSEPGSERKIGDVFTGLWHRIGHAFQSGYTRFIALIVRFRKTVILIATLGMAAIFVFLIPQIGFEFLPKTDQSKITIDLTLPSGASLEDTEDVATRIEHELYDMDVIEHIYVQIGGKEYAFSDEYSSNVATFTIDVTDIADRDESLQDISYEIEDRLDDIICESCESLYVEPVDNFGSDLTGGSWSGYLSDVAIQVSVDKRSDLDDHIKRIEEMLEERDDLANIKDDLGVGAREARLIYNYDKIVELGLQDPLNPARVGQTLNAAVGGTDLMSVTVDEKNYALTIGYADEQIKSVRDLLDLVIYTYDDDKDPVTPNRRITLGEIAELQYVTGYSTLTRVNGKSTATIYARITSDQTAGKLNQEIADDIDELNLPSDVEIEFKGSQHFMNEAFEGLLVAFLISVVLVYAVMAIQFQSFKVPLIIMLSLPMGLTGSIVLCYWLGYSLNVCSFIGMIMLVGIVVNNAIVLLDRVHQLRDRGMQRVDAIVYASGERLRPILMTSLTTIFGLLPLIITVTSGIGTLLASLAAVVAGGMVTSTILSLIVIPAIYEVFCHFDDSERALKKAPRR